MFPDIAVEAQRDSLTLGQASFKMNGKIAA
jgi:hypothetical protein